MDRHEFGPSHYIYARHLGDVLMTSPSLHRALNRVCRQLFTRFRIKLCFPEIRGTKLRDSPIIASSSIEKPKRKGRFCA